MWVIAESITAGLMISLINKYVISKNMFESCMSERVEEDNNNDISSVSTSISDSSSIHHIHV